LLFFGCFSIILAIVVIVFYCFSYVQLKFHLLYNTIFGSSAFVESVIHISIGLENKNLFSFKKFLRSVCCPIFFSVAILKL
jgi:hypothetical protein